MAEGGGVGAETNDSAPRVSSRQRVREVGRMGAIDHVALRSAAGGGVDRHDRVLDGVAARKPAVGLHREADHHR